MKYIKLSLFITLIIALAGYFAMPYLIPGKESLGFLIGSLLTGIILSILQIPSQSSRNTLDNLNDDKKRNSVSHRHLHPRHEKQGTHRTESNRPETSKRHIINENEETLYVGNLPYRTKESALYNLFGQYGAVSSVRLMSDRKTGRRRGFGFVVIDKASAQKAVLATNGLSFEDRMLKVNIAGQDTDEE